MLYAGLMITERGPVVLEFNARLGDPETQPLLMRLEDDLLEVLAAGAAGAFGSSSQLRFRREVAACIVLASQGYPDQPVKGEAISGLDRAAAIPGVEIFHAGTAHDESGVIVTSGGRVIDACATGATLRDALRAAYAAAAEIDWPSKVYRKDIGKRVLERVADEA